MRKVDIKHSHANNMGVLNSSTDIRIIPETPKESQEYLFIYLFMS
jgi:hypothetical protein